MFESRHSDQKSAVFIKKTALFLAFDAKKLEQKILPQDIDYAQIKGLRLEARQKLNKVKPNSVGQASRISGVSPADISVLLIYLEQKRQKAENSE